MPDKIPAWTASSIDAFITCPHKYYRLRVLKDIKDFPMGEQALWGTKVHKLFENCINWGDPLPADLKGLQPLVDKIKAMPGEKFPEFRFSIDEDLKECAWKEAWSRGAADLVVKYGKECVILDYKTGKRKPSDQLMLYAGYAFAYWPEIEKVHTAYVWLKDKKIDKKTYTRDNLKDIWGTWLPLVARLKYAYETSTWQKRPSGLCKAWCPCKDCQFAGV